MLSSGSIHYMSFSEVMRDTVSGRFKTEDELRQAFVEALKGELPRFCSNKDVVNYILIPMINRAIKERRKPDIRLSNMVIEVEPPGGDLSKGAMQLQQYMKDLASEMKDSAIVLYGVVTNGIDAEYYELRSTRFELKIRGKLREVMGYVLNKFCKEKIPVITPEDLVEILGV